MPPESTSDSQSELGPWLPLSGALLLLPPLLAFAAAIWPNWVPVPFVDAPLTEGSQTLLIVVGFLMLLINGLFLGAAYMLLRRRDASENSE